jgi:uncharacterized membrane protein YeaQ/YmgE (transglycosylase-associated protein family)
VLPGEQAIGILGTVLAGVGGSILGGLVGDLLDVGSILQFVFGVAIAAALIVAFEGTERAGRA